MKLTKFFIAIGFNFAGAFDFDSELDKATNCKFDVNHQQTQSQLDTDLPNYHNLIIGAHSVINNYRAYNFFDPEANEQEIRSNIDFLHQTCLHAEAKLGSDDYRTLFYPVHAYMRIKYYHVLIKSLIAFERMKTPTSLDIPLEIKKASQTLMTKIYEAKEKFGFDFYTMMERDPYEIIT